MTTAAIEQFTGFLDRDLSWLQFNGRVLHEANDVGYTSANLFTPLSAATL
jgi:polyphosphate kinase